MRFPTGGQQRTNTAFLACDKEVSLTIVSPSSRNVNKASTTVITGDFRHRARNNEGDDYRRRYRAPTASMISAVETM